MLVSPTGLDEPIKQPPAAAPSVEVTSAEVLISTQQVVFGTAIAVGVGRRTSIGGRLVAIARRILTTPTDASLQQRRHYPKRYGFLENALMAREMERL
ncbi:hypothetical protein A5787_05715 [Mycobacterium sp. 852002-50816_SCH5313054-b]|uniref:hypothetical protein n=1 Tax=Mycobacterium sp. 852002-50816_SCH5313054-b TaxID=1834092 RepID=UPI000801F6A9|nr:hypothetical protein [Mycobacterium sp. 852002-50816_SCH5313054-b]OBF53613.1 hypothetical protein A5787_05715 [Mycobacterium sp. 852002-50816_SCH5313054-b]